MAQIFLPYTNVIAKVSLIGGVAFLSFLIWIWYVNYRSPYWTRVNVVLEQPVPFSHEHHVSGLGIDCRYCHTTVEKVAFAGMPSTETCMTCHSQVWSDAPILEPVRASFQTGKPIAWNRVHDLPDFVYFNHSIHVQKGVSCVNCHGRVDRMPLISQQNNLYMKWCLDCHRSPQKQIRPREEIFNFDWNSQSLSTAEAKNLVKSYHINVNQLTDCILCHR
ncbi:MAG: cytochrome c family protein [Verrucomicrobiae bacterium]|nr:cytochrome c family protein [Verrucomicrobiae bacterium]